MQSKLKRGAFAAVVHVVVAAAVVVVTVVANSAVFDVADAVVGVGVNDGELNDHVAMNSSILYATVIKDLTVNVYFRWCYCLFIRNITVIILFLETPTFTETFEDPENFCIGYPTFLAEICRARQCFSTTGAQFHQRSMYSFYARISQKCKKILMT